MVSVFSDQQLASILLGLGKGDIPVKYGYITKHGAEAWDKLEKIRSQKGQSFADALLLTDSIDIYLQELENPPEIAVFDFGCGSGETIKPTLLKLSQAGIEVKYHAFDISQNIIHLCQQNLSSIKHCSFNYTIIDFEISNLVHILSDIRSGYKHIPVLGLLLGNTVGNFGSMERVVTNIMEGLRFEDRLVIGIERADTQNKGWQKAMMQAYNSPEVFAVFWATLEELGFDIQNGRFEPTFNERTSTLEGYFIINKNFDIIINNQTLSFLPGQRVRIGQSKKIDESSFSKLIIDLDLRIANIRTNQSNSYIQSLISAKKL